MFDIYYSEFKILSHEAQRLIAESSQAECQEKLNLNKSLSKCLRELKAAQFSMESQFRLLTQDEQAKVKKEMQESKILYDSIMKSSLIGLYNPSDTVNAQGDSGILSQLHYGSQKIEKSLEVANATHEISQNIVEELNRQTSTIQKINQSNKDINNEISQSNTLVNKMSSWWKKYF